MAREKEPKNRFIDNESTVESFDDAPDKKKRNKKLGYVAIGVAGVVTASAAIGVGVFGGAGGTDSYSSVERVEVEAGRTEVQDIRREVAEIHSVAFTTEVNDVWVEHRKTDRKAIGPIPAPDIAESVQVDKMYVESTLGLDAGDKEMTLWEEDGVQHIEYVIDPADIKVYSKVSPNNAPIITEGGSWNAMVKNGLDKIEETLPFHKSQPEDHVLSSSLKHAAEHLAIDTVNKQCGPKVFDMAKDNFLQNIEDALRRDANEEIVVKFPDDLSADEVAISGESDIEDALIALKGASEQGGIVINTRAGEAKECEVSPHVHGEDDVS